MTYTLRTIYGASAVLAGSSQRIQEAICTARDIKKTEQVEDSKLPDLVSRINGGEISIPGLDDIKGERDRRADKVCMSISILNQRYGGEVTLVPWCFLHFVANTTFRHGVRSITHLVELLSRGEAGEIIVDDLPLKEVKELKSSSLAYHLVNPKGAEAIVEDWNTNLQHMNRVRIAKDREEDIL